MAILYADLSDMLSAVVALRPHVTWCAGLRLSMSVENEHCSFIWKSQNAYNNQIVTNSVQEYGCSKQNKAIGRRAETQWDEGKWVSVEDCAERVTRSHQIP